MTCQRAVIGIDIGGTNLRLALVREDGTILLRRRMPTPGDIAGFLGQIGEEAAFIREEAEGRGFRVEGVGIGMPGLISPGGEVFSSVNLLHSEGVNLAAEIGNRTGLPVYVANDANAAACGEYRFGAGSLFRSFLMVTIGTGIGGGVVLNGELWEGDEGFAGEFGHLTVEPEGRACRCGNRGCLEQYASASAIVSAARLAGHWPADRISTEWLAGVATAGDGRAALLFEDAGRALGIAAAAVVNLLNVSAIIIGGGVGASFGLLAPSMMAEMGTRAFRPSMKHLQLLSGRLGDDAGVLGAAALVFGR